MPASSAATSLAFQAQLCTKSSPSPAGQRVTDPRDDAIPLRFLGGRVVNQYAVHEASAEIATVVPNLSLAKAGDDEEPGRHPLVYDVRGWVHFCKKHSRRISGIVWNGLDRQICSPVRGQKAPPIPRCRFSSIFGENCGWNVNGRACFRDCKSLPRDRVCRCWYRRECQSQGDEVILQSH